MIFVPIGYTFGAGMFEMEKVKGGSPYGAGTYAGDGSRQPSELELEQAFHQGKYIAGIAKKLKGAAWFAYAQVSVRKYLLLKFSLLPHSGLLWHLS